LIGKAGTGGDFRGLARYLLRGRQSEGERVGWTLVRNMPVGADHAASLMSDTAAQNVRVQKPVYHLSLSAAPGEELSREQWEKVVDKVLRDLGLDEHQALVVGHRDKRHDHVHIMVNRVHPEHLKVWHNGHDYRRIEQSLRNIERDLGLREVPGRHARLPEQQAPERQPGPTSGERRETERTGRESWAEQVRFRVYNDLREAESWADLERRLARHRLRLEKRGPGLVVTDGKRQVKASRLYRGASYGRLEKRFGQSFDEWRSARREVIATVDRVGKLERQRLELRREASAARREIEAARTDLGEHRRARTLHRQLSRELDQELRRVYPREELPRVRRELERHAQRRGWEKAGRRLAREPRRFGKVRGAGVGPVRSAQRSAALRASLRAGRLVADVAAVRATRIALGPTAAQALVRLKKLRRTAQRATAALDRLPSRRQLENELAHKAVALGLSVLHLALAPNPLRAVKTALRAAGLVRSAVRGDRER
jgi:hypothetical protein